MKVSRFNDSCHPDIGMDIEIKDTLKCISCIKGKIQQSLSLIAKGVSIVHSN